jgi:hypothetical protein
MVKEAHHFFFPFLLLLFTRAEVALLLLLRTMLRRKRLDVPSSIPPGEELRLQQNFRAGNEGASRRVEATVVVTYEEKVCGRTGQADPIHHLNNTFKVILRPS